jgi:hypothetical protein
LLFHGVLRRGRLSRRRWRMLLRRPARRNRHGATGRRRLHAVRYRAELCRLPPLICLKLAFAGDGVCHRSRVIAEFDHNQSKCRIQTVTRVGDRRRRRSWPYLERRLTWSRNRRVRPVVDARAGRGEGLDGKIVCHGGNCPLVTAPFWCLGTAHHGTKPVKMPLSALHQYNCLDLYRDVARQAGHADRGPRRPALPITCTNRSVQPFITSGCMVKSGTAFTMPGTFKRHAPACPLR